MKSLLTTLHAKYVHNSLALPALAAACADLPEWQTVIREYTVNEPQQFVLRKLLAEEAELIAFSCYIWNIEATLRLVDDLHQVAPETIIVLGGPEASFGVFELMERHPAISCVVRGEGETTFREYLQALVNGGSIVHDVHLLNSIDGITFRHDDELIATPERAPQATLDRFPSPFSAGLVDLGKPLIYFETSRGCPFNCAFCMSSLEKGVRSYSQPRIEADLELLLAAGVKTVKLVDRTFNYDAERANRIWDYILRHNRESRFHFEIAADLLTEANLQLLRQVPAGLFRFEIGVQAADAGTLARVGRRSDNERLFANVRRLLAETGVIIHLDLLAGLPNEDMQGFLASLELLLAARPQHIQVEPLKVLKGSPMRVIAREEGYAFSATPPYKVLTTPWLSYADICRIETIARLLDLIYNSGRFATLLTAWGRRSSLAELFAALAKYWEETDLPFSLPLHELYARLWQAIQALAYAEELPLLRDTLCYDYCCHEIPVGQLPAFFCQPPHFPSAAERRQERLAEELAIPAGARVRSFQVNFARDYRFAPWQEGPVTLQFVYAAIAGEGLRIHILPL